MIASWEEGEGHTLEAENGGRERIGKGETRGADGERRGQDTMG